MMSSREGRRVVWLILVVALLGPPVAAFALQPSPDLLRGIHSTLSSIPTPQPIEIRPRLFTAYGALVAAATLGILYLYRGRAFVVYWIASWTLLAGSYMLIARGYEDVRLGSVMIGLSQLLGVWAAGLLLLSIDAFSEERHRWNIPVQAGAASAVWFLAAPFILPLSAVLFTGPAASAVLRGWASFRYARLTKRTPIIGAFMISAALAVMSAWDGAGAIMILRPAWGVSYANGLLAFNVVTSIFIALGMHLLVFEDMTDEIRRTNLALALANEQVRQLAITDPLTGCHNRRSFDEIERREMGRHRRYDRPLSVVFVDLDRFKQLNDTFGHDTGDKVLRTCGELLREQVRQSDYVIRWGGDEFILLLSCTGDEALVKASELKAAFALEREAAGLPATTGLSVGVAEVQKDSETLVDAIRAADAQMYRDKPG